MRKIGFVFLLVVLIGGCSNNNEVTPADLQHHRWMLTAINNESVDISQFNVLPTLDFGDQMFVEVHDGCRQFSAMALLESDSLVFQQVEFINVPCNNYTENSKSLALNDSRWVITIPEAGILRLESEELVFDFKLNDWR